jgi:uncharacterized repeat protein (TIGR03803 family)
MRLKSFAALMAVTLLFAGTGQALAYSETVIHKFCTGECHDGAPPVWTLTRDSSGNLYGATDDGKNGRDQGTIFKLVPSGAHWRPQVLYRFRGLAHVEPRTGVILDVNGNIYSVARDQIFELTPGTSGGEWTLTRLYKFCHHLRCTGLSRPISSLTYVGEASGQPYDGVSALYGTTEQGGAQNSGVIYQLQPNQGTWSLRVLHNFCGGTCSDGMSPAGDIIATQDALYGVTGWGGNVSACGSGLGCGVVYQLSPKRTRGGSAWKQTILHRFCVDSTCSDGFFPFGITLDTSGSIIGTAEAGGTSDEGVIYKLIPHGRNSAYSVLHSFCSACGETIEPSSAPTIDGAGSIFGNANLEPGAVYKFDGSTMTTLHQFCSLPQCRDGEYPVGGLVLDPAGNLFGVTIGGGGNNDSGTVFEIKP